MIERYTLPEMKVVWSDEAKLRHLARGGAGDRRTRWPREGRVPKAAAARIAQAARYDRGRGRARSRA